MSKKSTNTLNTLLDYFKVPNHEELMRFILDSPCDTRVQELKEVLALVKDEENDEFI